MINCEFSEKLYEILVINEFLKTYKNSFVYCPSQVQEGKTGYDALFNFKLKRKVLMFQFKICKKYLRNPKIFMNKTECFKFVLHSNNSYFQHNKLVQYNKTKKYLALYCAPKFFETNKLYEYYINNTIMNNSLLGIPNTKINNNKYHYINYDCHKAYQHSNDNVDVKIIGSKEIIKIIDELDWVSLDEFEKIVKENGEQIVYFLI